MAALRTSASTRSTSSLERFTKTYPWLRGYALLPWLLPMTITFVGETGVTWLGWVPWLLYGASLVGAFLACRAVLRWYDRKFGVAWQRRGEGSGLVPFLVFSLVFANLVIVAFIYLLPPLLMNWFNAPEWLFGPEYHWPWVLGSLVLLVMGFVGRPYFSFFAFLGGVLLVLAVLPLGEWVGVPEGRHLLRTSLGAQGLRILLLLSYAFASHASLVRGFHRIQERFGLGNQPSQLDEGQS